MINWWMGIFWYRSPYILLVSISCIATALWLPRSPCKMQNIQLQCLQKDRYPFHGKNLYSPIKAPLHCWKSCYLYQHHNLSWKDAPRVILTWRTTWIARVFYSKLAEFTVSPGGILCTTLSLYTVYCRNRPWRHMIQVFKRHCNHVNSFYGSLNTIGSVPMLHKFVYPLKCTSLYV